MRFTRTNIFILISSLALIVVLIIQVNWIMETAKAREAIFNEKANMVLARTTDALKIDTQTSQQISSCMASKIAYGMPAKINNREISALDSLFNYYMNFYNFKIDYTFEVTNPLITSVKSTNTWSKPIYVPVIGCYEKKLDEIEARTGLELKLILPQKKQFILAELSGLFITSVLLILTVLFLFWRTVLSLIKQKKISEHNSDFLNNMTHEFKTPLTNIALAGKMIMRDSVVKQTDKLNHYSEIILAENEKLKAQVEQVLSMTALERGEIPLIITELDLHSLIADSIKYMSMQIDNREGKLSLNLAAENFMVMADKTHLTNVFCNLVDNAIKYSAGSPEIQISSTNKAGFIVIQISDKGIGIDKKYMNTVFNKYFRVPTGDVHNVKGFGLGLAYVKKIIELHHGTITLESEKNAGTTFTITLPDA